MVTRQRLIGALGAFVVANVAAAFERREDAASICAKKQFARST